MGFARADVTEDRFLGGQLTLMQPRTGYRAGVDPVFLAAAISAQAGESVLDLGCGAGAAALCLGTRVQGLRLVGVERQADYADLARINSFDNDIELEVYTGDLTQMPPEVAEESFDQVIMNPPYHLPAQATTSADPGREAALFEETPLAA
ncbi:MAG: methyltransferase, partial [Maritimibacter sp.]|nr:methyltransferase [Maritimibacter sp.]